MRGLKRWLEHDKFLMVNKIKEVQQSLFQQLGGKSATMMTFKNNSRAQNFNNLQTERFSFIIFG